MRFVLGLTGGIGSGKSAATAWFEQQGIDVIDADIIAREVVKKGQPLLQEIQNTFGDWVILENGELDRKALREYIFQNIDAKKTLEGITHPAIRQSIIDQLAQTKSPYSILVSPLLFETNQHQLTNHYLLIDAPEEIQLQRAMQRDQQSETQIRQIIQAQMPSAQKQILAHDIALNDGHLEFLYAQLQELHQNYLRLAAQPAPES